MNKYEDQRRILRDDKFLESLCRAYLQSVRCGANETAFEIRHRTMEIYKFSSKAFGLFVKACQSSQVSRRSKLKRLEHRIRRLYEQGDCHFLTLTWNDDALVSNSAATRKRFVREALNDLSNDFVANVDFGKTTHREHYHAVTLGLHPDELRERWKHFGFIKVERVIPSTECSLALYVDKLCNHALKETTCKMLMYCRKRRSSC